MASDSLCQWFAALLNSLRLDWSKFYIQSVTASVKETHFWLSVDGFVVLCKIMTTDMFQSLINIVVAFRGMHVSPAKHSYAWLPRKCDYRTDRRTDGRTHIQTNRRRTKWSLCAAMLRRRHNKPWLMDLKIHIQYNLRKPNCLRTVSKVRFSQYMYFVLENLGRRFALNYWSLCSQARAVCIRASTAPTYLYSSSPSWAHSLRYKESLRSVNDLDKKMDFWSLKLKDYSNKALQVVLGLVNRRGKVKFVSFLQTSDSA